MTLYTIGFTKKPASAFFSLLRESGARRLVDVRLNPGGQLSGFAKGSDLAYFLRELCGMDYLHMPELAPTREMLDAFRKGHRHWPTYEREFLASWSRGASRRPSRRKRSPTPCCCAARTRRSGAIGGWWPSTCSGAGGTLTWCTCGRGRWMIDLRMTTG